ncbi:hypothetical protein GCM10009092_30090 [Bowmanella denitrificans]|uniref:diguanylate cyclase n=1 Tax=Bowmanella denitrificans TaxID=366582 RepID=A0ABP3HBI8_9ALTE
MLDWLNASLTRKIGGLSTMLLSFLLVVILYSVVKLQVINDEMREVAEIDIPLSETMAEIEMLQLRQHLLMEQIGQTQTSATNMRPDQVNQYSQQLSVQIDKAIEVIRTALDNGTVQEKVTEHQSVLASLQALHQHRDKFTQGYSRWLEAHIDQRLIHWQQLQDLDTQLDDEAAGLLLAMEQLTLEIAAYAEKHEREFMWVNSTLGVSALAIGIYLTLYIIQSFRRRIGHIQHQIGDFQQSLQQQNTMSLSSDVTSTGQDELAELETDIKTLMDSLSKEMHNRVAVEKRLIELATLDRLTGAFNRHKWEEQISEELALADRGAPLSLLLLDVDHFKSINDGFGHDMGDQVLKSLVTSLRQRLRSTDMLFRIGGEEFAILLRQHDRQAATLVAEQLRMHIEQIALPDLPQFTASIGASTYRSGDNAQSLMKRADQALYEAKQGGRNRVMAG